MSDDPEVIQEVAKDLLWYVEAGQKTGQPQQGSAVRLRLKPPCANEYRNYLLTCLHVVCRLRNTADGVKCEPLPVIRCWREGATYDPDYAFMAKVSELTAVSTTVKTLDAHNDWVLLELVDCDLQMNDPIAIADVEDTTDREFTAVGYAGGASKFSPVSSGSKERRVHFSDESRRGPCVFFASLHGDAKKGDDAHLHARGMCALRRGDVALEGIALGDLLQSDVVAGFRADVEPSESAFGKFGELDVLFRFDVSCHGVAANSAQLWKQVSRLCEDRSPVVHRHRKRVAVGDEELRHIHPYACVLFGGEIQVFESLVKVAEAKRLVAIHIAVGAVIPRTPDGGLEDVCVVLRGRAEEFAFVAH